MIIDILEWDITYNELIEWVDETGAELDAIYGLGGSSLTGGSPSSKYEFHEEKDYIAFKLKFRKE